MFCSVCFFFFFKQKTEYEMRISDWSSDVCSSDLTQVTIGPVIENGFYYDFFRNQPFTPEDLPVIERKMREIIARDKPFTKEVWTRDKAGKTFRDMGEARSEERRVGKSGVRRCRYRGSPDP